jgi:endonuclease/exonuclease/phosphatase (EEP) superfamily protein YafD
MEYLKTLIDNTNQNLILMGDLNMTTTSKRFTNFLKDTNLYTYASYKPSTFTWPAFVPGYLGIQIDHVLFSENFKVIRKKTANHFGSDHRPLLVDLAF